MSPVTGTIVGSYEVVGLLGSGGMGDVYRARDTRLGRDVALKVLPERFASDAERLARFKREAQVLASLNHPNIGAIYGFEESGGVRALVLEIVEGETLADRIARGPIPVPQALALARQIADALEVAHEKGIVHRDLKPANIKVRPDGTVKVLDFGLAKAYEVSRNADDSVSPTLTSPAQTMYGVVLGTAAYMSPEQAAGGVVDQRSDIWSFGVVLYEMLSGRRLFDGDSVARVLAQVLEREIDFRSLSSLATSSIGRLLRRCLERDPKRRFHHIGDVRLEIEEAGSAADTTIVGPPRFRRNIPPLTLALGVLVLVLGAMVAWLLNRTTPPPAQVVRSVLTVTGNLAASPARDLAVSSDGMRIAYSNGAGIYIRALDQVAFTELEGTDSGVSPVFSPDGAWLLFYSTSERVLKRIPVLGGTASRVIESLSAPRGYTWGPNDTITFASTGAGLFTALASGGEPAPLTNVSDTSGDMHIWPAALPNGKGVLFSVCTGGVPPCRLAVVDLANKQVTDLKIGGTQPQYSPTGHIIFAADGALRAVGFDQDRLALSASPSIPVVERVQIKNSGSANFDLSMSGLLAYSPSGASQPRRTIVWVDRTGRETPLPFEPRGYSWARVSPDGARLTIVFGDGGRPNDVWVSDLSRPAFTRITATPTADAFPVWTPDGRRVAFSTTPNGMFWTAADGTGNVEPLLAIAGMPFMSPEGWADDGETMVFTYGASVAEPRIGLLSLTDRQWKPLIDRVADASMLSISPDRKWLAYQSDDSGQYEVYIERFPELGNRQRVSTERGGWAPVWAPSGRELFYRRLGDGAVMSARIQTTPGLSIGDPSVLFENRNYMPLLTPQAGGAAGRGWDVAPDGRFLMIKEDQEVARGTQNHPGAELDRGIETRRDCEITRFAILQVGLQVPVSPQRRGAQRRRWHRNNRLAEDCAAMPRSNTACSGRAARRSCRGLLGLCDDALMRRAVSICIQVVGLQVRACNTAC